MKVTLSARDDLGTAKNGKQFRKFVVQDALGRAASGTILVYEDSPLFGVDSIGIEA